MDAINFIKDNKLTEISRKTLFKIRYEKKIGLVFKYQYKYFYTSTDIKKVVRDYRSQSTHICANCEHMSAAPDCDGGCANVRDFLPEFYLTHGHNLIESIQLSNRIEKYDFIKLGLETFNNPEIGGNVFLVNECQNFEKPSPHPQKSIREINRLKLGLAQYIYPDLKKFQELYELSKKNY